MREKNENDKKLSSFQKKGHHEVLQRCHNSARISGDFRITSRLAREFGD
jgi:hypothetical protein